jgi:hypothetical protein
MLQAQIVLMIAIQTVNEVSNDLYDVLSCHPLYRSSSIT